jgi:hypothetical protein
MSYDLSKVDFKEWEEVGGMGEVWDYKTEYEKAGHPESGVGFRGSFMGTRENVGPNNSKMHAFEEADTHKTINLWGTGVLDDRLSTAETGEEFVIVYVGKQKPLSGGGQPYHNFKVYHQNAHSKANRLDSVDVDDIPFN